MPQSTTLLLFSETSYINPGNGAPYTVTGNTQPAAAYYLGNRDLQTVNTRVSGMTGNIVVEASLATSPVEADWFKVYQFSANANAAANSAPEIASNASVYTNIEGNFVFMRAKIEDFQGGIVQYVKLSY